MTQRNGTRGFSLIELLIVIAIIGVLSTVSLISFGSARRSSRDARRIADVKQIQLALKNYYNDNGYYPTAVTTGRSIAVGSTNYLLQVPSNPAPRDDKDCPDEDYTYTRLEGGQRYALSFCLSSDTDSLDSGIKAATNDGILNCPEGYVPVVGSSIFNTPDFCAMKYEARCDVSPSNSEPPYTSTGAYDNSSAPCGDTEGTTVTAAMDDLDSHTYYPIANVDQAKAKDYCQGLGGHLMTNNEWMTIVRNIEAVDPIGPTFGGYFGMGNFGHTQVMYGSEAYGSGLDPENGFGLEPADWRRSVRLSTGATIYDIAGNLSEILDATCETGTGYGKYDATNFGNWFAGALADYEKGVSGPVTDGDNHLNAGRYLGGCTADGNIFVRGGSVESDEEVNSIGPYEADLGHDASYIGDSVGFRCVL